MKIFHGHKKKLFLALGLIIAAGAIVFKVYSIYTARPGFNFLYVTGNHYTCLRSLYRVQGERLGENAGLEADAFKTCEQQAKPEFYIYDVKTDESREVSFQEAQKIILDPTPVSTDHFRVICDSGIVKESGFFAAPQDYNAYMTYTKGFGGKKKLNFNQNGKIKFLIFLGWLK